MYVYEYFVHVSQSMIYCSDIGNSKDLILAAALVLLFVVVKL